jgi:lysophospholipid acyltransferase (LPLAT)-like uncharacterized protein
MLKLKHKIAIYLLHIISMTWRINVVGEFPQKPAIIGFWHGKMLPVWKKFAGCDSYALVSQSKDGEILTNILKLWKFNVLRGSSSKSGKEALNDMIQHAELGYLLITPDGPRGPHREFKPGAVIASVRSGVALVLCGCEISSRRIFTKSWDKFNLPLPFSKITLTFSEPKHFDKDASRDEISLEIIKVQNELNMLCKN